MAELCHRCGNPLLPEAGFCAQCGAPQLYLTQSEQERLAESATADQQAPAAQRPRIALDWRPAIRAALLVAGVAGGLSLLDWLVPPISVLSFLWTSSAALIALAVYRRRADARVNAGIGTRIGVLTGIFTASALVFSNSLQQVLERYVLHRGAAADAEILEKLHQQMDMMKKSYPGQPLPDIIALWAPPEHRAWLMLFGYLIWAVILLLFFAFSGALSGWLRPVPRRLPS